MHVATPAPPWMSSWNAQVDAVLQKVHDFGSLSLTAKEREILVLPARFTNAGGLIRACLKRGQAPVQAPSPLAPG